MSERLKKTCRQCQDCLITCSDTIDGKGRFLVFEEKPYFVSRPIKHCLVDLLMEIDFSMKDAITLGKEGEKWKPA